VEYSVKIELKGFESIDRFRLEKVDETFAVLHSLDDSIQLSLVNPYKLTNYSFDVPNVAKALLQLREESNVEVYLVLLLSSPKEDSRANFLAPIIFNSDNGLMGQVILTGEEYKNYKIDAKIQEFAE
jgi:flagellar assembly factor FliW